MAALMSEIGHTVALAVWGNQGPTIVHWQESPHAMTILRLGDVMPLLTSATGRCFAAFMPKDLTAPMMKAELARLQKIKHHDVPNTMPEAKAMLAEVRQQGLARVTDALLPGVTGFAAPVFDSDAHLALAMVSLGPTSSFDSAWDGTPAKALRQAAEQLSAQLGHRSPPK